MKKRTLIMLLSLAALCALPLRALSDETAPEAVLLDMAVCAAPARPTAPIW